MILTLSCGGHKFCSDDIMKKLTSTSDDSEIRLEEDKLKAMCFLVKSGRSCYSRLLKHLKQSTYLGRDEYFITLTNTYGLLVCHSSQMSSDRGHYAQGNPNHGGRVCGRFSVMKVLFPVSNGTISNIQCSNCNKWGHIYKNCTEPDRGVADSNSATGGHGEC